MDPSALFRAGNDNSLPRLLCFFFCRLVPHLLLGLAVLLSPMAFSTWATYLLASGGMAYMNLTNLRRALTMVRAAGAKVHTA